MVKKAASKAKAINAVKSKAVKAAKSKAATKSSSSTAKVSTKSAAAKRSSVASTTPTARRTINVIVVDDTKSHKMDTTQDNINMLFSPATDTLPSTDAARCSDTDSTSQTNDDDVETDASNNHQEEHANTERPATIAADADRADPTPKTTPKCRTRKAPPTTRPTISDQALCETNYELLFDAIFNVRDHVLYFTFNNYSNLLKHLHTAGTEKVSNCIAQSTSAFVSGWYRQAPSGDHH
jgi:hypothetical protein